MNRWLREKLSEWQDVGWVLFALVLAIATYEWVRYYDPRAGVDGFGSLAHWTLAAVKGFLVTLSAWLCKRTYTRDLTTEDEATLADRATRNLRLNSALAVLLLDRLEWAAWIVFWYWVYSH